MSFIYPKTLDDPKLIGAIKNLGSPIALISDHQVISLYGSIIKNALELTGHSVYLLSIAPGEQSKTREMKANLEDQLEAHHCPRTTVIIGLGGGVITDLSGFVAATYCRGVPFVSIPTTLMAMVDAAIGGKVGVNTGQSKNKIGAFYPAHLHVIYPPFLDTLPCQELQNGLAEIIKYALIAKPEWIAHLQPLAKKPLTASLLYPFVEPSIMLKNQIVHEDPKEKGLRRILNFGHTIAHAYEKMTGYQISHGQAVGFGLRIESRLSYLQGFLPKASLEIIESLLNDLGYLNTPPDDFSSLWTACLRDKKNEQSSPRFVQLQKLGCCHPFDGAYCKEIDYQTVYKALYEN